ncbi:MAG: TIGR04282 family arsenosugar biosynthesis glycosyltransferase [Hyphomicrobiales bacterium]|nr:TIGR04282 family arsenosugar biosynthesis glycosyltransferase [Hyphomicrobiales bacterium]MBV9428816.1 TIGR04282 family arsenosugar biosynthesis glycosyltransferase [Bradyrhizobiaceae bacterium]
MASATPEPVALAILAKAPAAGAVKTRLTPALGADGAAALHARLIQRTVETACAAATGPVTLWVSPAPPNEYFTALASRFPIGLAAQPDGDLGVRMLAACQAATGPVLVIGTDCPALTLSHLHEAADALRAGSDVVVIPAEDGGYVLIGTRRPQPGLFAEMTWGVDTVMAETRRRVAQHGLRSRELPTSWDVDRPEDLARLRTTAFAHLLDELARTG